MFIGRRDIIDGVGQNMFPSYPFPDIYFVHIGSTQNMQIAYLHNTKASQHILQVVCLVVMFLHSKAISN